MAYCRIDSATLYRKAKRIVFTLQFNEIDEILHTLNWHCAQNTTINEGESEIIYLFFLYIYISLSLSFSFPLSFSLLNTHWQMYNARIVSSLDIQFPSTWLDSKHNELRALGCFFFVIYFFLSVFFFSGSVDTINRLYLFIFNLFVMYHLGLVINTVGTSHSPVISCWSGHVFRLRAARHVITVVGHLQTKPHKLGLMAFRPTGGFRIGPSDSVLWSRPNGICIGNYSTRDPAGKCVSVRDLSIWRNWLEFQCLCCDGTWRTDLNLT